MLPVWIEFDTDDVPARDRFDCWAEFGITRSRVPVWLRCLDDAGFRGSTRALDLGDVQIFALSHSPLHVRRTSALIRRSDPEAYQFVFVAEGECVLGQAEREARIGAGEFAMYDTSRPFTGLRRGTPDVPSVVVAVPRALVPLPGNLVAQLTAVPFDARCGMGAVLRRWSVDVLSRTDALAPPDARTLASATVDLVAAALAAPLHAEKALSPEARRRSLRLRIDAFIDSHLGEPALTPTTVAAAHHISLRLLQRLFAEDDTSPAASIRRRRLERCRLDLADPDQHRRPIHVIAARWGFADHAHFSRLFRTVYGLPPKDYRARIDTGPARMINDAHPLLPRS